MDSPIPGMQKVVATVSGYHGTERFNLIKLISNSGASYVGGMSKSITHLICWKFEGKKFELAKKFEKTIIVNHRWIEDCIKRRKRVPEHPYVLQSGEEIGPLLMEVPVCLNENNKALVDKSNIFEDCERLIIDDKDCGDSDVAAACAWTDSFLLDENFFPEVRKSKSIASKSKLKKSAKTLKQERKSSDRYCLQDPPLSGRLRLEEEDSRLKSSIPSVREKGKISGHQGPNSHSKRHLERGKRKISDDTESNSSAEPSCGGRRLVKQNFSRNNLEIETLDSDEDCLPIRLYNRASNSVVLSKDEDSQRKVNTLEVGRPVATLNSNEDFTNEVLDDTEEISGRNHTSVSEDSNSCQEKSMTETGVQRPDGFPAIHNLDDNNNAASQSERATGLPTSVEVSCAICWTEFCPTRGILPCGHRFCYSCIQKWSDHVISSGKMSTCPLCKTGFVCITKVEDAATSDQKIYSQTIPCASTTNILMLDDHERYRHGTESSSATVCGICYNREPEDLLVSCDHCRIRCIHRYCLDPPLFPWTCIQCKDLQRLYYHAR
ncbi:uncharacterized protein LOC126676379 [Mercurialis annua]|uniref:uncharacterized protein LOC126676379 n=1 Tax=Mercurialis annua TaxID=3986 RepID=UPI002160269C|nr:uncharacterized protein LOC126676379 [Mercurialis annua]